MKQAIRTIIYTAVFGGLAMGLFGVLTTMDTAASQPSTVAALVLAFLVAGTIGALMAGTIIGIPLAVIGTMRRSAAERAQSMSPLSSHQPHVLGVATGDASGSFWIGTPGQPLETRATVLPVSPYSDVFAERAVRYLHWLRTPAGHALRWLANDPRGLSTGDEIILRGTVKEHSWDGDAQPVTEVWYCRTRTAPRENSPSGASITPPPLPVATEEESEEPGPTPPHEPESGPASPAEPAPPPMTDERRAEMARRREAMRAADEKAAARIRQQGQRSGALPAAPLAPVRAQPQRPAPEQVDLSDPERVNTILRELDAMPGLEAVTEQVASLAETVRGNERRKRAGLRTAEVGLHLILSGPPGTAKTTVANAWGRVLCATGLLPTDRTKVVKREDLVGQHVGSTAIKTREVIDGAVGGVLFIDEAYSLASTGGGGPDFGAEAVEVLLARMEEERGNLAVIVAGYPDDIEMLLASNAGLRSRFEETIHFKSYDAPTLVLIARAIAHEADYEWDDEALNVLRTAFTRIVAAPPEGWANGREVRKILGQASRAQSRRLGEAEPERTLTADDTRTAIQRLYPQAV
ncbi:AAA family ATPase [Kocuria soli]|uniref:AAA family ATPase n=1 Tax=Kocuria soli TaxID=2485125 RepID=A0A3N3ZTA1_9MICC|nr:AAA family ATPase [Kocuria soli]ROZ63296.1 AAA family ATPase [Kocuria soli]